MGAITNKTALTEGFHIGSQTPADDRLVYLDLTALQDLGTSDVNAYRYYEGMPAFVIDTNIEYRWVEASSGALTTGYTYPANTVVNGVTYSGRTFNFVPTTPGFNDTLAINNRTGARDISVDDDQVVKATNGDAKLNLRKDDTDGSYSLDNNDGSTNKSYFKGGESDTTAGYGDNNTTLYEDDQVLSKSESTVTFTSTNYTLTFEQTSESNVAVFLTNDLPVTGLEFEVYDGAPNISTVSGGTTATAGYSIVNSNTDIIGFSTTMTEVPISATPALLFNIDFASNITTWFDSSNILNVCRICTNTFTVGNGNTGDINSGGTVEITDGTAMAVDLSNTRELLGADATDVQGNFSGSNGVENLVGIFNNILTGDEGTITYADFEDISIGGGNATCQLKGGDSSSLKYRDEGITVTKEETSVSNDLVLNGSIPTSASSPGTAGTIIHSTGFIYICVSTDTWERVATATW